MNLALKRQLGRAGIFGTAVSEFLQYEFPGLEVEIDGVRHAATFAVVCRARHYAGTWIIAPDARARTATQFDVLLFADRDRAQSLPPLPRDDAPAAAAHLSTGLARVIARSRSRDPAHEPYPVDIQVDGDCVLETPVACHMDEAFVRVLVPRH